MDALVFDIAVVFLTSMMVAIFAGRAHFPYTVALVIAGAAIGFLGIGFGIMLGHDLIYDVILPPLLFEAAFCIRWPELWRDAVPVLTLAVVGVVISAVVVALALVFLLHWPAIAAAAFGVLIAATDPVAVVAMLKDAGITGRLRLLVESESLLNDGVAATLFALVMATAPSAAGSVTAAAVLESLVRNGAGGIGMGLAVAAVALRLAAWTRNRSIETALTVIAAYSAFLLAERFHMSGVLAAVTAGLLIGNFHRREAKDANGTFSDRPFVTEFWDFAAFIANSMIFLLIGAKAARTEFGEFGVAELAAIPAIVLVGRAATVYPLCLIFRGSRWSIRLPTQHVLWWGGLRGALGLALALGLPADLPYRQEILIATILVVVFSVVVEGGTMSLLLRWLGLVAEQEQ